ncbi:ATP synthase F1 subunit delta [Patescibacteria group bacterium]
MRKVSPTQYAKALLAAYDQTSEDKRSDLLKHFVLMLKKKRDMKKVDRILNSLAELVHERDGIISVDVVTAKTLTPGTQSSLVDKLRTALKKDILLQESVNPKVIGGVRVRIGDTLIDGTVRHSLDKLKSSF